MTFQRAVSIAKRFNANGVRATATWKAGAPVVKVAFMEKRRKRRPRKLRAARRAT